MLWSHHQTANDLCGGSGSGVDIRADERLAEDGQEAALSLLALGGAGVDEIVDGGGGDSGVHR